jgi:hypothetical protein
MEREDFIKVLCVIFYVCYPINYYNVVSTYTLLIFSNWNPFYFFILLFVVYSFDKRI